MRAGGMRVLVIDDNADIRTLVRWVLESEGFEVSVAADGNEGLLSQRNRPAEVIVTDIFMPVKEGIETIHALHLEFPEAKIIAMSGGAMEARISDYLPMALQFGAARFLRKPFQPQELIDAVRDLTGSCAHQGNE